jgi:serine/threonine protein kinase/Flp pilus assembly protein TadD
MSHVLDTSDASAEAVMGALVDEFLERLGRGERPEVEEYARRHPRLAAVLRQMLPALQAVHGSAADRPRSGESPPIDPEGPLGDFRIVREIGRGGMGVVYEAVQISLGRRVALKVLPFAAALDAKQLRRFLNEAQAAAHLHHPNIVPVYGVGCERGVHYYAMQLIDGRTLAALIQDLRRLAGLEPEGQDAPRGPVPEAAPASPTADTVRQPAAAFSTAHSAKDPGYFRTVAGLAVQAALALEHAHNLGVVHRDVKPANLLVDAPGNLWVTDFGLARVQTDARLTLTGDLVGTLRYMSPEQALARPAGVDHRADLYSLGATLYELLTLEPAFTGRDRQELLRQIAFEEPRPPRRVNRAVPAELETIVLKALAKDPAERYATAGELADDLRRFLEDKPVRARRPSWLERGRKWARRHRPAVWSAAAALLVTLAVLAGSVGWVVRDRSARQARAAGEVQAALDEAQRSRQDGKWPQAQAAAKRAEALLQDAAADPAVAERVRGVLRELAEEEADRRLVARLDEIRLLQTGVNVTKDRFVLEESLPEYREAFKSYGLRADTVTPEGAAELLRRRPPAVRDTLVAALDHWLILARYKQAAEAGWLGRVLAAADPDPWRQAVRAARDRNDRRALEKLAREVDPAAQPPEALFLLDLSLRQRGATEGAVALLRRAQQAFPGDFWINHDLGVALQHCQPPQPDEAIRFLTAAVALRPQSPGARLNLGSAFAQKGRLDEAIGAFRQAAELRPDYVTAYKRLGAALDHKGQLDEAVAALRQAIALKPDDAGAHSHLGYVLWKKGRLDEAAAALRRAVALNPDDAVAHANLGNVLLEQGRPDEAIADCRRAIELKPDYAGAHCNLGIALGRTGRLDAAAAALRRAIELRPDFAVAHCNLGDVLRRRGEFTQALVAIRRGHELGSRRPDWPHPSARWVRECERLVELDGRLPAVLRGEAQPAGAAERIEYAQVCYYKTLYAAAARLRAGAFGSDPKLADDLTAGHRYDAACAAALAGCGRGADAGPLSDQERARWRKQALDWLRADLAANAKLLEGHRPQDRRLVGQRLRHWQGDPDLAGLRDPAALAALPAGERESCQQFWAEVQALLARAGPAE